VNLWEKEIKTNDIKIYIDGASPILIQLKGANCRASMLINNYLQFYCKSIVVQLKKNKHIAVMLFLNCLFDIE
jgi:hypothetical protein